MLFAKTSKSASRLCESFKDTSVTRKVYLCVVHGELSTGGTCDNLLFKKYLDKVCVTDKSTTTSHSSLISNPGYRMYPSRLRYYPVLGTHSGSLTLVKVQLETGRKHQIRAQLSHIGHPIVGDTKYGSKSTAFHFDSSDTSSSVSLSGCNTSTLFGDGIALHSSLLSITHPVLRSKVSS